MVEGTGEASGGGEPLAYSISSFKSNYKRRVDEGWEVDAVVTSGKLIECYMCDNSRPIGAGRVYKVTFVWYQFLVFWLRTQRHIDTLIQHMRLPNKRNK